MFEKGDRVVHPGYGAGVVDEIKALKFLGNKRKRYYAIQLLAEPETTVTNSIFWGNLPYEIGDFDGEITISYSLLPAEYGGTGNIEAVPAFVDFWGGDYHLQADSPAIDAADGDAAPEADFDDNERVDHDDTPNTGVGPPWADIGAFEYQP